MDKNGDVVLTNPGSAIVQFMPNSSGPYFGRLMKSGLVYTIAGTGLTGISRTGVVGTTASLSLPWKVAFDGNGDVFIDDRGNNCIDVIPKDNASLFSIEMLAGHIYDTVGECGAAGVELGADGDDGPASKARLDDPEGMAVDHYGDVLIADTADQEVRFVPSHSTQSYGRRMVVADIYAVAGSSNGSGVGAAQTFAAPTAVAYLPTGNGFLFAAGGRSSSGLFVVVQPRARVVRTVVATRNGLGSSVCPTGLGGAGLLGSGTIFATVFDSSGDLLVSDSGKIIWI